jgi:hypothetical protein
LQEYANSLLDRKVICCDENNPCVPANINENEDDNSNNKKIELDTTTIKPITSTARKIEQQIHNEEDYSHRGKNPHSKTTGEDNGLDIEHIKPDLKSKIQEELEKSHREQVTVLKENKQNIIDFLVDNKDSIKIEDLKSSEPIYKCYREKVIVIFVIKYLILFVKIVLIPKEYGYV